MLGMLRQRQQQTSACGRRWRCSAMAGRCRRSVSGRKTSAGVSGG